MKFHYPIPDRKDTIRNNLIDIKNLLSELQHLKILFYNRLGEAIKDLERREQEMIKITKSPPTFTFENKSGSNSDIQLNLYCKCFCFIFRQTISKTLHLAYLLKKPLSFEKVDYGLKDGSIDGNFTKFIEDLLTDKYKFDKEILDILKTNSDMLISSRVLRNSIKYYGSFEFYFINKNHVRISCPISKLKQSQKALSQLKNSKSVKLEDLKTFVLEPHFIESSLKTLTSIFKLLESKYDGVKNN